VKTIKEVFALVAVLALLGLGYEWVSGSHDWISWTRGQVPEVTTTPDEDHIRVKMSMVIDGDDGNRVPNNITIRFKLDGKWNPTHGGYITKKYWTRTIEVRKNAAITLQAANNNNRVTIDIVVARDDPKPGQNRVLCHDVVTGKYTAECSTNAT